MDWLNKARQYLGNLFGGAAKTVGNIAGGVARGVGQAEQQAARVAQQAVRNIPQAPRFQLPQVNIQAPRIQMPQAPKVDFGAVNRALQGLQQGTQQFGQGVNIGFKQITGQQLAPREQQVVNIARQQVPVYKVATDIQKGLQQQDQQVRQRQIQANKEFINKFKTSPGTAIFTMPALSPFGNVSQAYKQFKVATGKELPKFDTTKAVEDLSNTLAQTPLKNIPGAGVVSDIVKPLAISAARMADVAQTQEEYANGIKGLGQMGLDIANIGSLIYSGGLSRQLATGGIKAFLPTAAKLAPRLFASGAGQNIINQLAQGKKINELDPKEILAAGAVYTGLGIGIPGATKGAGILTKKLLGNVPTVQGAKALPTDKNALVIAGSLPEKGALRAQGYTNVQVNYQPKPGQVTPTIPARAIAETAPVPKAPKGQETLYAEAHKYKSADEFVKGQGKTIYHGTANRFNTFDTNKIGESTGVGDWGDGFYFTDRKDVAKSFAKDAGGDIVMEVKLSNLKLADGNKLEKLPEIQNMLDDGMGFSDIGEYLKKKGYDGIKYKHIGNGGTEYVVYNPSKIKTKQQLTDIWNQANKQGPQAIYETVPKSYLKTQGPKSFDELIKSGQISKQEAAQVKALGMSPKDYLDMKAQPNMPYPKTPEGQMPSFTQPLKPSETRAQFANQLEFDAGVPNEVLGELFPGYKPLSNETVFKRATQSLNKNQEAVVQGLISGRLPSNAENNATAMIAIRRLIDAEDYKKASELAQATIAKGTDAGRAVQIFARWRATTPEGALLKAEKVVNEVNKKLPMNKKIELGRERVLKIQDIAKKIQTLGEGTRERQVQEALLAKEIMDVVPPGKLRKISTLQTMAQLLNAKTAIRNVLGNTAAGVSNDVSNFVGSGVDAALFKLGLVKQRTVVIPSLKAGIKGFAKGAKYGTQDVKLGIKTSGAAGSYDIQPQVFKNQILRKLENVMGYELSVPDKAFYQKAFDTSLDNQMRAAAKSGTKVTKATAQMIEQANEEGLYQTFQNNSGLANGLVQVKHWLNAGKDFGVGDLVLKYPKTPGNIVSQGIDFTPVGIIKGVKQLADATKTATLNPTTQRQAILNIGRGLTGTGLISLGAVLANVGIMSADRNPNKNVNALDVLQGGGPFTINLSALQRYATGGNPVKQQGDMVVNYDWLQPNAIQLSMGANMVLAPKQKNKVGEFLDNAISSTNASVNSIIEQPVLQGVSRVLSKVAGGNAGKADIVGAISDIIASAPAGFIPSILNQVGQMTDKYARETKTSDFIQEITNKVQQKIPGLREGLPIRYTTLGAPTFQFDPTAGGNNIFNVFLNPSFPRTVKDTVATQLVDDLYNKTGSTEQFPKVVGDKVQISKNGKAESLALNSQQISQYQQYVGERTNQAFTQLANDPAFQALSPQDQTNKMSNILEAINSAAKIQLFGANPQNISGVTKAILNGQNAATYQKPKSTPKVKVSKARKGRTGRTSTARTRVSLKAPRLRAIKVSVPKGKKLSFKQPATTKARKSIKIKTG